MERDQGCHVTENKQLIETASFDGSSVWDQGILSLFVVEEVMLYLDLPDILEAARVCSHWYSVVQDKIFWKKLLKLHRKLNEDNLVEVLEPELLYKRLYKMEHAKAVTSSDVHHGDFINGVEFSHSGNYLCSSSSQHVALWRKNEDTGAFEIFKKIQVPAHSIEIFATSFNESDDCILLQYTEEEFHIQVLSIPDCCKLKNVKVHMDDDDAVALRWFGRYTFLVQIFSSRSLDHVFTLYSVNAEFEPHIIYTTLYADHALYRNIEHGLDTDLNMAVFNDNDRNEKKIVLYTYVCVNVIPDIPNFPELQNKLNILTATSDFSGEFVGPNTSTCLTERKFSSPDPKHYSCSHSLTKPVRFDVSLFSDRFPDKIAMVCIPNPYPDIFEAHASADIRLYDFELNLLGIIYSTYDCSTHFYFNQHCILAYDATERPGVVNYFDLKYKISLDIVISSKPNVINRGRTVVPYSLKTPVAFSPRDPDILCCMAKHDEVVTFFDFSV